MLSIFVVLILLVALRVLHARRKAKRKRELTEKVTKGVNDLIRQHLQALVRRRFQTLRHDPYGNLLPEPWNKEMNYFIENVLDPAMRQIGYKEY